MTDPARDDPDPALVRPGARVFQDPDQRSRSAVEGAGSRNVVGLHRINAKVAVHNRHYLLPGFIRVAEAESVA